MENISVFEGSAMEAAVAKYCIHTAINGVVSLIFTCIYITCFNIAAENQVFLLFNQ